jgi:hypothetical protein
MPQFDVLFSFILLEKELEEALEPAEPRVSGAFGVAGVTRLELAASGVTGRRSNHLSYTPNIRSELKSCLCQAPGSVKQT